MDNLILYSLEGCGYSMNAEKLINDLCVKAEIIKVKQTEKDYYKKRNEMNTFPQIFLNLDNNTIKIGGYNDLTDLINYIKDGKKNKSLDLVVNNVNKKYDFDKKRIFKIIDFFL